MLCAVKSLKSDASFSTRSNFFKEAETLALFDHPNIVRLLGVLLEDGDSISIVLGKIFLSLLPVFS